LKENTGKLTGTKVLDQAHQQITLSEIPAEPTDAMVPP
jgi:hypothetical protein